MNRRGRWQAGCWQNLPEKLAAAAVRLSGVALEHGDAIDLIARYDEPGTGIYCDPPYAGPHRLVPGKGYEHDQAEEL
jgi:DNA adenine methylase